MKRLNFKAQSQTPLRESISAAEDRTVESENATDEPEVSPSAAVLQEVDMDTIPSIQELEVQEGSPDKDEPPLKEAVTSERAMKAITDASADHQQAQHFISATTKNNEESQTVVQSETLVSTGKSKRAGERPLTTEVGKLLYRWRVSEQHLTTDVCFFCSFAPRLQFHGTF